MTAQATLRVALSALLSKAVLGGDAAASAAATKLLAFTNGTGVQQITKIFADARTIEAASDDLLDMGDLTDAFGASLAFSSLKALIILPAAANPDVLLVGGNTSFSVEFTADATANTIDTDDGHVFVDGEAVTVALTSAEEGDGLPTPLIEGATYYVVNANDDVCQLALAPDGDAIDLDDAGQGTLVVAGFNTGGLTSFFSATGNAALRIPPNGCLLLSHPGTDGYAVVADTADILKISNPDAEAAASYDIYLLGE